MIASGVTRDEMKIQSQSTKKNGDTGDDTMYVTNYLPLVLTMI